jgi:catechol 2,3-dioxygenase-like lactoylglutathione lyase family enzyme/uncharacterized protein YndB with AHSA1/START domain
MAIRLASEALDVGIVVRDLDAAVRFYHDTLGLPLDRSFPTDSGAVHPLVCGAARLKLVELAVVPADANPRGGIQGATGLRYLTLYVEDLDDVLARCRAAATPVSAPKTEVAPGIFTAVVEDPDGSLIELVQGYVRSAAENMDLSGMVVEVSRRFGADIAEVWALLSDVERMAGLGPEHVEARWVDPGPAVGARFTGLNRRGDLEWATECHVVECDPPRRFVWAVADPDNPSSTWSYTMTADLDGTIVVQRFEHGPNYSFVRVMAEQHPDEAEQIVRDRTETLRSDMAATLANAERLLVGDNLR